MKRALLLAILLGALMSSIFVLPPFRKTESALKVSIPTYLGSWQTHTYPASQKELDILAGDTGFSKAKCGLRRIEEISYITGEAPFDIADLSVVLSGHDLANSIHRPERCMPAQGHRNLQISGSKLTLSNGRLLPLTRILSKQDVRVNRGSEAGYQTFDSISYYFFVGHDQITANHTERTLIDIKNRIVNGQAQRWAFVSASMTYLDTPEHEFGAMPNLELADKKIRLLLKELAERNIDWNQIETQS